MTPTLTTYIDQDQDLQTPFDVAVVIPTLLRDSLVTTLRSVFQQDLVGRVHILIGIDQPDGQWEDIEPVLHERPAHMALSVFYPGYSTSIRHGGLWPARSGGSLRTILSFLANARQVAYLDDDNWYSPMHLRLLLQAGKDKPWAFSRRWFVTPDGTKPICEDSWESVGPDKGVFSNNFGGFVDGNCYLIEKIKVTEALPYWSFFLNYSGDRGDDRAIFSYLRRFDPQPGDTQTPTSSYLTDREDHNAASRQAYVEKHQIKTGPANCPGWSPHPQKQTIEARAQACHGQLYSNQKKSSEPIKVSVVIPTILRSSLRKAVQSIYQQQFEGRIQVLIGVDGPRDNPTLIKVLLDSCPDHVELMILCPGYSTSRRHGGVHEACDGGSLRSLLSFLARAPYVAYLDDDNHWHPDHLQSLYQSIQGQDYAYSLRTFIHPDGQTPIAIDEWESIGPNKGLYASKFGGFCDPNTLMMNTLKCFNIFPFWTKPLLNDTEGMSADRHVFHALSKYKKGRGSKRATVNYILSKSDPMHPLRILHLGHHWTNADLFAYKKHLLGRTSQKGQQFDRQDTGK